MKSSCAALLFRIVLAGLICNSPLSLAQTTTTPSPGTSSDTAKAMPAAASNVNNKLVESFTGLAGSRDNATSLITGLRTGGSITLVDSPSQTDPATSGSTATSTGITFSPETKPMGYGNIRIALSLARTQLASQGITNPTAEQLQGALMGTPGGSTGTATQGVLQMRAAGMGWGQIANSMGVKLGTVMSGRQTMPVTTSTTTGGTTAAGGRGAGAISSMTQRSGGKMVTGAGITGSGYAHGKSGVVTASGGLVGGAKTQVTTGFGGGHASATGAVNANGGKSGTVGAMGNAGGKGKP